MLSVFLFFFFFLLVFKSETPRDFLGYARSLASFAGSLLTTIAVEQDQFHLSRAAKLSFSRGRMERARNKSLLVAVLEWIGPGYFLQQQDIIRP